MGSEKLGRLRPNAKKPAFYSLSTIHYSLNLHFTNNPRQDFDTGKSLPAE